MKKIIAKSAALIASASILASTIMPVFADTATNDTTGYNSVNDTSVTNSNNVKVENVSDAFISNTVKTTSNTGNNSASQNTMGGMIQTGDATSDVAVLNSANINTTLVDLGRDGGLNTAGNSITGAKSDNDAVITNSNRVGIKNDNTAVLQNNLNVNSNTGGNFANQNTDGVGGMVQTGDAVSLVSLANRANDSATGVRGLNNFGSNVVGNSITGFNSMNDASITNANSVTVNNVSDAFVSNTIRARANTGANSASQNTMGGLIQSGNSLADIGIETDANIVTTNVDAGMADAQATSGNSITGAKSFNTTTLLNNHNVTVTNRNNKDESEDANDPRYENILWGVVNIDVDESNTGGNFADQNTYPSSVASGIAMVGKYIRVCLNDTLTSIGSLLP